MPATNVPAVVDGVVADVKVKAGDTVKAGELLVVQNVTKVDDRR